MLIIKKNIDFFKYNLKPFFYISQINNNLFDKSQTKFFNDKLILVDNEDNKVGEMNKLDAHLKKNKNKFPHRAFSVLLFNKNNELLLQQRSKKKVTYPLLWTNTVCSHPLNIESENKFYNIKNAVIKRVKYEIGLKTNHDLYNLFTRIIYRDDNDKKFEEYELDYIFLGKINDKKFNINNLKKLINKDEIENIKFKNINWILNDIKQNNFKYTPWFKLLLNKKGVEIDNIINNDNLYKYKYNGEIINFI